MQLEPAVGAEQRLAEHGLVGRATAREVAVAQAGVHVRFGIAELGAGAQVRQEAGACLRNDFLGGTELRAGRGEIGIVVDRLLVDADQVRPAGQGRLGRGQSRSAGQCGQGEGQGKFAEHGSILG